MSKRGSQASDAVDPRPEHSAEACRLLDEYWEALSEGREVSLREWLRRRDAEGTISSEELVVLKLLHEAGCDGAGQRDGGSEKGSAARTALDPGSVIDGKLEVLGPLDAGGMGEVYVAWHQTLGCRVAVKVPRPDIGLSEVSVDHFRQGTTAQARLRGHENIVFAMDAGVHDSRPYLVMEYVPGTDLASLVKRRGPRPWRQACDYVRQAALGLEFAHSKGIVHRDIKPSNLILSVAGPVKILDWGVACRGPVDAAAPDEPRPRKLVLGSYDYLAPEQAECSEQAGPASDLYSLGATFFFLLTGRAPFSGYATPAEKLAAHRRQSPGSVRDQCSDVPASVDRIVGRLLRKDTAGRFRSARELIDALDKVQRRKSASALRRPLAAVPWLLLGLAAVVGAIELILMAPMYDDGARLRSGHPATAPLEPSARADRAEQSLRRGDAHLTRGDWTEAIAQYNAALEANPDEAAVYYRRGVAWQHEGEFGKAIEDFRSAIRVSQGRAPFFMLSDLALLLAASPQSEHRQPERARELATRACEMTTWKEHSALSSLAAACAADGDFAAAARWQEAAIRSAPAALKPEYRRRREHYERSEPLRLGQSVTASTN